MLHFALGALGFIFAWAIFYLGYRAGLASRAPTKVSAIEIEPPTDEELSQLEAEREKLRQDQAAFHDLMGYNADVAYGRQKMPGKE